MVIFHLQICVEMTCFEVWRLILLHFSSKERLAGQFFSRLYFQCHYC